MAGLLLGLAIAAQGRADDVLATLRAEIDAAYYARDLAGIEAARTALLAGQRNPAEADAALYYAAYARFRQSLVVAADKKAAREYLDGCIEDLESLIGRRKDDARAHAMLASCYGTSAQYYMLRAPARGLKAGTHIEEALRLAPDDPWVMLQDAIADASRPAAFGGDKERARAKLERAAALFAAERTTDNAPSPWGESEAWLYLGRLHRDAGRGAEARRAFERSLALSPGNRDAEEDLARLE